MKKRTLKILVVLLCVGVALTLLILFAFMRPLTVEVARPDENVSIEVFGLGTVEARIVSKIGFEVGGALVDLSADHGDRVRKGVVLARLHGAQQKARVAKARAGLIKAEAVVMMAEAATGRARVVLAQRKQTNERRKMLVARKTISAESADEAQMEEDVAVAEFAVAISDVAVAKAVREDATAQVEFEEILLDHHTLRAPYDAIVVKRHKELGSVLTAGEPLFTLVAPETVWALAYVDEARAGNIRVGQSAEVRLRSLPRQVFQGQVARIDIESDRVSEERRVYISCDRFLERFHLGEQIEVVITTTALDEALLIPEIAVEDFDGTKGKVWTVEDGHLQRRTVAFGHRALDSRVEVIDGLPSGALVVKVLRSGLREGRAARVLEGSIP